MEIDMISTDFVLNEKNKISLNLIIPGYVRISQEYWDDHKAWDISTKIGTPIKSAGTGQIKRVGLHDANTYRKLKKGEKPGYGSFGNYVIVSYPKSKVEILFAHLSRVDVKEGDIVRPLSPLGLSGNSGFSQGPHVHMEVRHGLSLVSPGKILSL